MLPPAPDRVRPLPAMPPGQRLTVRALTGEAGDCVRLREMGFCEQAELKLLSSGGAVVCLVCGARVCLSRSLAASVLVAPAA